MNEKLILAFDTVISSGDVSLKRGAHELSATIGDLEHSASETLLTSISRNIENAKVEKGEIDLIAVTLGPGSYTGIRIGIATALGLAASIGCQIIAISTLELLANCVESDKEVIAGVWAGRNEIAHQEFDTSANQRGGVGILSVEKLASKYEDMEMVLDGKSRETIISENERYTLHLLTPPENIASLLARVVAEKPFQPISGEIEPIYSRSLFDQ